MGLGRGLASAQLTQEQHGQTPPSCYAQAGGHGEGAVALPCPAWHCPLPRKLTLKEHGKCKAGLPSTLKYPCCLAEDPSPPAAVRPSFMTSAERILCPPWTSATLCTRGWSCPRAVYLLAPRALFTVRLPSTALHTELLMSLAGFFSGSLLRVSPFFIISNELIS